MPFFKLKQGSVVGFLNGAKVTQGDYGERLTLTGQWDGNPGDKFDVTTRAGEDIVAAGFAGQYDDGTLWVDNSRRIFIGRSGEGTGTRWEIREATDNDVTTVEAAPQQQQQRRGFGPPQQRPPQQQAQPPRPQQQPPLPRGGSGTAPPRPPATNHQPHEDPAATKRRIKATYAECLRDAADLLPALTGAASHENLPVIQAIAATLFIEQNKRNLPLLPDPQAPAPTSDVHKDGLRTLRKAANDIGLSNEWFDGEVVKFGRPAFFTEAQGEKAIKWFSEYLSNKEAEIRKAELARSAPAYDPPPPANPASDIEIPF